MKFLSVAPKRNTAPIYIIHHFYPKGADMVNSKIEIFVNRFRNRLTSGSSYYIFVIVNLFQIQLTIEEVCKEILSQQSTLTKNF